MSEWQFIDWIRSKTGSLGTPADPVVLGPGDDAGIVRLAPQTIAAVDMLMDGVHFDLKKIPATLAGRKALAVNLSDLAAMGAKPVCALVSLALPTKGGMALGEEIMEGILELAKEFDVTILGGDTNSWAGRTVISVTVLGEPLPDRAPLTRSGARPGDWVLVTGSLGGSLGHGKNLGKGRHLTFTPRVREAAQLNMGYEITSMIDLSDGLATDAAHVARESGLTIFLNPDRIPVSPDVPKGSPGLSSEASPEVAKAQRLKQAMTDGEDFELLFTSPPDIARKILTSSILHGVTVTHIGECRAGDPVLKWQDGTPINPEGYQHQLE
ncbi:MAG: thiamine-phosphate kinase [Proteobacteria bacterium]|nr:thiamine-phosphate kinase [Pseudomonadota bacterium]